MTHCKEWESQVALYAGGDPVDAEVVRHVEECAACHRLAEEMAADIASWQELPEVGEEAVEEVRRRVMAAIDRPRRWVWLAAAAAAVFVAALGLPFVRSQPEERMVVSAPKPPGVPELRVASSRRPKPALAPTKASVPALPASVIKLLTDDPDVVILLVSGDGEGE